ncbi:YjbQ family protein [Aerococcus urinaeequi]|uniref:YjbQ family protein n=1 Tax=Aerococcus urinaeequi TaxID=51665 RepID=UPI003D6B4019
MAVFKNHIKVNSKGSTPTYVDITEEVRSTIENSGIKEGICVVLTSHTTCSIFYEEFVHDLNENGDEFLQEDLNNVLEKIIPNHDSAESYIYPGEEHYQAVEAWPNADEYLPGGDRSALWNGDAHLKATIIGSSETFEVSNGALAVGKTGYIYFADFDRTRARERKCSIVVLGE